MIAFLSGKLLEKNANTVIVDVGGVGYEVTIPLSTFYELGEPGTDIGLRIYTHVREDAIQLFGFKTTTRKGPLSEIDLGPGHRCKIGNHNAQRHERGRDSRPRYDRTISAD